MRKVMVFMSAVLITAASWAQDTGWQAVWDEEADSLTFAQTIVPALKKASAAGDQDAAIRLCAVYLTTPWAKDSSIREGKSRLLALANAGNAEALISLGESYITGNYAVYLLQKDAFYRGEVPIQKDIKKGLSYFDRASGLGSAQASYMMGLYLANGEKVPRDVNRAVKCLLKAGEAGVLDAYATLSFLYEGYGDANGLVEPDIEKSLAYARTGAEKGHGFLQYRLAESFYYPYGEGEKNGYFPDKLKFAYWLKKSAEGGYPAAQYFYGLYLIEKKNDEQQGREWIKKASDQGLLTAMASMGGYYWENKYYGACLDVDEKLICCIEDETDARVLKARMRKLFIYQEIKPDVDYIAVLDETYDYLSRIVGKCDAEDPLPFSLYSVGIRYFGLIYEHYVIDSRNPAKKRDGWKPLGKKAITMFQLAGKYEEPNSLFMLYLCYSSGDFGAEREDQELAKGFLIRAARAGSDKAINKCHERGINY